MFIIWGWRAVKAVVASGLFFCPRCRSDGAYHHVHARRWFTLFFLPLIPLNDLGSYVECQRCKGTFDESVLRLPTAGQLAYLLELATRASVALVILAAGVSDTALVRAAELLRERVSGGADPESVRRDVAAFAGDGGALRYVAPIAEHLSPEGAEDVVRRLVQLGVQVAPASHPGVDGALGAIAQALRISPAHLAGIRAQVGADRSAGGVL